MHYTELNNDNDNEWAAFIDRDGQPIFNPYIINHERIEPCMYDLHRINQAAASGELQSFGINLQNLRGFIVKRKLASAIII
jgi:hypothetical protein